MRVLLLLLLLPFPVFSAVYDGATFDYKGTRCRVYGVEAPAKGQFFHETSKAFLAENLSAYSVKVVGTFHADREGVLCVLTDKRGATLATDLLERGYGHAALYADAPHRRAEEFARRHRFGLWNELNPPKPWNRK